MGQDVIPSFVEDEELLDRVVFEPSFFYEGKLAIAAFALRNGKKPEDYLSVLRDKYCDILKEVLSFGKRSNGDEAVGYAQLETKQVRAIRSLDPSQVISMEVKDCRNKTNPAHAGIFAKINDKLLTGEGSSHSSSVELYIQSQLLKISTFHATNCVQDVSDVDDSSEGQKKNDS